MSYGFNKLALGVTGVALLSGTTLALGPTIDNPPSLIITDRTKAVVILDGGPEFDDLTVNGTISETYNNYIFTEALDLSTLITVPSGATLSDVEWDFAELDPSDDSINSGSQTITVSDGVADLAGVAAAPDFATLTGSPRFADVDAADPLTFTNTFRSTNTTGATATFDDLTRLRLFAATNGDAATQVAESATFDIITTNDTSISVGDDFSVPSTAFIPVAGFDDLGGWSDSFRLQVADLSNQIPDFIGAPIDSSQSVINDVSPTTVPALGSFVANPAANPPADIVALFTPPATDSITLAATFDSTANTLAGALALPDFSPQLLGILSAIEHSPTLGDSVAVSADTLYMIRWNLSSSADASQADQLPLTQLTVGASGAQGIGRSIVDAPDFAFNHFVGDTANTPFEYRQYFYAHDAGDMGFAATLVDLYVSGAANFPNGKLPGNITINSIDVFEVNEAALTGEAVLFNQGADTVTLAAGETIAPPTGSDEFDMDIWLGFDSFAGIAAAPAINSPRNVTFAPAGTVPVAAGAAVTATNATAAQLSFTQAAGNGPTFPGWSTINSLGVIAADPDPVRALPIEAVTVNEGDLVFSDFYVSATGSTVALPFISAGLTSSQQTPDGSATSTGAVTGAVGSFRFEPRSAGIPTSDGNTVAPAITLGSSGSSLIRFVYEVQLSSTSGIDTNEAIGIRPVFQSFSIPVDNPAGVEATAAGTLNLDRVVFTKYDPPVGGDQAMPSGLIDQ